MNNYLSVSACACVTEPMSLTLINHDVAVPVGITSPLTCQEQQHSLAFMSWGTVTISTSHWSVTASGTNANPNCSVVFTAVCR